MYILFLSKITIRLPIFARQKSWWKVLRKMRRRFSFFIFLAFFTTFFNVFYKQCFANMFCKQLACRNSGLCCYFNASRVWIFQSFWSFQITYEIYAKSGLNPLTTNVPLIQKPINRFLYKSIDWFLFERDIGR